MTKRVKLLVAGALFAVSFLAGGLLFVSFTNTVNATNQAAVASSPTQNQVQPAAQPEAQVQQADDQTGQLDETDQVMNDLNDMAAAPDVTGTRGTRPARPIPPFGGGGPGFGFNSNGPELQGIISKTENNGSKLTVNGRVVNLNDQTVVGDANGTFKREDLQQGDRVMVLGKVEADKSITARWVLKLSALPVAKQGTISSVDAANNTFKFKVGSDNTEWTATVVSGTQFSKNGNSAKLSDFVSGDKVVVVGKADQNAKKIEADRVSSGRPATPARPAGPAVRGNFSRGTVKSVDAAGNSFVLTQQNGQNQSTDVKVTVDSTTQFSGQNLKGLADLKPNDNVVISGAKQSDGSYKATRVVRGFKNGRTGAADPNFNLGTGDGSSVDSAFLLPAGDPQDLNFYLVG